MCFNSFSPTQIFYRNTQTSCVFLLQWEVKKNREKADKWLIMCFSRWARIKTINNFPTLVIYYNSTEYNESSVWTLYFSYMTLCKTFKPKMPCFYSCSFIKQKYSIFLVHNFIFIFHNKISGPVPLESF